MNPLVSTLKALSGGSKLEQGLLGAAGVAAGAELAAPVLKPLVTGWASGPFNRQLEAEMRRPLMFKEQLKRQRLQQIMAMNEAIIAAKHPHMYAELLQGRSLPRGAQVFGDVAPRRDFLEQAVYDMSLGGMGPPAQPSPFENMLRR